MASSESGEFLIHAATYLGAAAVAVPVFSRFKLGSILGYLAAGVIIGPSGLNLMRQQEGVFDVAELGVVLFLFVIGLELSLPRLWALRRDIFGLGAAQIVVTGAVIAGLTTAAGVMPAPAAILAGFALAFSSTAFALQYMKERGELSTPYGKRAFPILLMQDIAVVPLIAAIPFLAGTAGGDAVTAADWNSAAKAAGVLAAIIVATRYGLNPLFHLVARSGSREAFSATALFIVAAVSIVVSWAGLSMALGAFLAGVMLAESAYRHQIETDIEPFRGLLLGLFFISIGMRLDLGVIAANGLVVIGGAVGLAAIKAAILFVLALAFGASRNDALKIGAVLSQGGEFAFVAFTLGVGAAVFTSMQATLMAAIVTVSMVLTPLLMILARRYARSAPDSGDDLEGPVGGASHVIVAGFGRTGQIISQVIQNAGVEVVAIDRNPGHIRNAARFGFKVYYGDASRLDTLETAGLADAAAVVLCMDDADAVSRAVSAVRRRYSQVDIFVIAHDRMHEIELRKLDPDLIVRETLESSLLMSRKALESLGFPDALIDDYIDQFRERDRQRLLAQMEFGPEAGGEMLHHRFEKRDRANEGRAQEGND